MSNKFKSFRPRKKLTVEEYTQLCKKEMPTVIDPIPNMTENGHYFKEVCARCGKPYGFHYGIYNEAFCSPLNPEV